MAQAPRRGDALPDNAAIKDRLHEAVERGRATAQDAEERLRVLAEAEENAFGFWLEISQDQMRHNAETWQNLAGVRDMRALIDLQTEYVRLSLARCAQLMAKQAEFAASLMGIAGRNG